LDRPQQTAGLDRILTAMAATKTKAAPVGSAAWMLGEKEQAAHFIEQEAEEFGFSVRNDLDWLNEHLADVFSQNNG
jgi:hypothetical protein